jgi:3-methylcrotonyl-CoA carboxylase beta subunit
MARLDLVDIGRPVDEDLDAAELAAHRAHVESLDAKLAEKVATVHAGWGEKYVSRVHAKGKWTTWERINALIDDESPIHEVGTLVNWGRDFQGSRRQAPGAGVVTCFAKVQDRWVIVIANDNTVASGAWWPKTPEKIERAQEMALKLRLPVVYLVDCSGLFLPEQSRSFSGRTGAGHIFCKNAELASAGVPQIAAVFGDCIAGGGYMPIISDRVYMTEGAYMVIAGAALIRGAKSQKLTSLGIGGAEVHVHQSGCADERVPDDATAIRCLQAELGRLPGSAVPFYRHGTLASEPRYSPDDLTALFPPDFRRVYDIEQVIARLVDDSMFHEVLPGIGREIVTGVAKISGLWVGIIANRQGIIDEPGVGKRPGGALYREGIAKTAAFSRACSDDGIPLVWLQDISGFDIGVQAERQGLLGYGSSLIYGNATATTPVFTVLLRKASGAGYYAMSGLPYNPVVQLATPLTRLAVMEGRTLSIATYNSRLDDDFEIETTDPEERAEIEAGMATVAARIEADMDPVKAAARMDADEVVPLSQLRSWLVCLVESSWQSMGYRRTKNPRIWSLHDLAVLAPSTPIVEKRSCGRLGDVLLSSSVGFFTPSIGVGQPVTPGVVIGHLERVGRRLALTVPSGMSGQVVSCVGLQQVEADAELVRVGTFHGDAQVEASGGEIHRDVPEGCIGVRADTDGTVYRRPDPDQPEYVQVGTVVAERATLALVEVMKTFSPVRSTVAGTVERVLVEDSASVAAGDLLFVIRP